MMCDPGEFLTNLRFFKNVKFGINVFSIETKLRKKQNNEIIKFYSNYKHTRIHTCT